MYGRDLEVIYLIRYGWTVREQGTRTRLRDHLYSQLEAINIARGIANDRVHHGVRTVEVVVKTKWTKRTSRASFTVGYDPERSKG